MKDKFSALKTKIWNEFHIVYEPFQTPIFQLYKDLHGIFQKYTHKILRENRRFIGNSESKREFFTKYPQVNIFLLRPFLALIFEF